MGGYYDALAGWKRVFGEYFCLLLYLYAMTANKFYGLFALVVGGVLAISFLLTTFNSPFTRTPIISGTLVLAGIFTLAYTVSVRGIVQSSPHRFVNTVTIGTIIKLLFSAMAALLWLVSVKKNLNKPDLFYLMGVYSIFSIVESAYLAKFTRLYKK